MSNKKIFICDDDEGIIDLLKLILEETEHTIITDTNSLNARLIIETEKPDLIILDLWMPMLSGDQILKILRKTQGYQELPVIIISASRDGKQIATEAGATAYLAKPFDMDVLLSLVDSCLQHNSITFN